MSQNDLVLSHSALMNRDHGGALVSDGEESASSSMNEGDEMRRTERRGTQSRSGGDIFMEEEGSSEESLERGSPGEAEGSYLSSSFAPRGEFVEIPIHEDSDDTESDRLGL